MKRLVVSASLVFLLGVAFFWENDGGFSLESQKIEKVGETRRAGPSGDVGREGAENDRSEGTGNVVLASPNRAKLLDHAKKELEDNGRYIFAVARDVAIAPHTHGQWIGDGETAKWVMELESEGAESLNLGFGEFRLPNGGELVIRPMGGIDGELVFTSIDNDAHGELWTPIVRTDRIGIELNVPRALAGEVRLALNKVNHGFRSPGKKKGKAIGDSSSGACNIDVICSAADSSSFGPLIDRYRDEIRSVGAYTVGGIETCSGALINNTRNDGRPFFLTADHCGISTSNAPSVVVYWNFENTFCRTPNTSESGRNGNGSIARFNSGAIFRAANAASDFCLIELDDPVNAGTRPFYAGWDRSNQAPSSVIGIHHPGVSEKRISFELDPTSITSYSQSGGGNTHIMVADWDFGTTEGGSSGSPLFNPNGRIVGQLHGGAAACGNDAADWYGRLFVSWNGGGSPNSRLSNWLDPGGTGATAIDGTNLDVYVSVTGVVVTEGDSGTRVANVELTLSEASGRSGSVRLQTVPDTATSEDFVSVNRLVTFGAGLTRQTVPITIYGDVIPEENESFSVVLSNGDSLIESGEPATVTILNDDFIDPVITSGLSVSLAERESLAYQITAQNTPQSYEIENGPAGLEVDGTTGVLSWRPIDVGEYTVDLIAVNPAGEGRQTLTITVTPNTLIEALDLSAEVVLDNAVPGWRRQTVVSHDGEDAAQAEDIVAGERAEFSIVVLGPDVVSFWWKVDSEERYDFLSVSVDGTVEGAISGQVDWVQREIVIPEGEHEVNWSYEKDDSADEGLDTAWIDELVLGSETGLPVIVSARKFVAEVDEEVSYEIRSLGDGATYEVTGLPAGLTFDGGNIISGSVGNSLATTATITATEAGAGSSSSQVEIVIVEDVGVGVEDTGLSWLHSGEAFWGVQTAVNHDGVDAIQSGDVGDGESSILSAEITGPDAVSFFWKVDSEEYFDFLLFKLDGEVIESISGDQDWQRVELTIPSGRHVLTWEYFKDTSDPVANGSADAGWVDELRFLSDGKPYVRVETLEYPIQNEPLTVDMDILNSPTSIEYLGMPDWLSVDPASGDLVGVPPETGPVQFLVRGTNLLGVTESPISFLVTEQDTNLEDALDLINVMVSTSPRESWVAGFDFGRPFVRGTAAESIPPGPNGTSQMTFYVQGPGRISFNWAVSSEEDFDFLVLELNGRVLDRISGEVRIVESTLSLPAGIHEVSFFYRKDGDTDGGKDRAWVDNIRLEGYAAFLNSEGQSQLASTPDSDEDGDGFGSFEEYAFGGALNDPETPGDVEHEAIPGGGMILSFRGLEDPIDVHFEVERSETLEQGSWTPSGLVPTTSGGRWGMINYEYLLPKDGGKEFFRLQVEPKEPN